MRLREFFDQIRQSSPGTLVALAAVVVVWVFVLAMIIAGIVFYFERPNLAQPPAPGAATAPAIVVEPTAGPAGTTVVVTGQGWAVGSRLSIYLLAPGQTQIPNFATAQATADAQGQFATAIAIPLEGDWLAPGTAQVVAEVAGGGVSARTVFVVLPTTPTPSAQPPTPSEAPGPAPASVPTPTPTPTEIPTPTPGPPTATANTAVNVRLGPGTNYPVMGTLLAGQSAGITGVSPDGAWWQIGFAGGTGWVSSFYVRAQNTQNVPVVTPPPLPPTPTPVPQAPVAVINAFNQGPTGQVITFDGSGSRASPGHSLVAFAWDFGDGTTANGVTVSHSYSQPGNYVVTLTVTDDQGLTAETTQVVQFQRLPPIPIIGGPSRGTAGDSVTFDGSQSIANSGIIVDYEWNFGDGTTASGIRVDHAYDQPGRYRVILTTTNSAGLSASADHDIRIEGQPRAVINAPSQGQVGQPITFSGSGSNVGNNAIVRFAWNFGDGASANGQTVTHVYAQPGSFVVTLTVTTNQGLSDTASQTIYISQVVQAPTAIISAPNQGTAGRPLTFDGTHSAAGSGQIISFAWSFGDGASANGPVVTHAYAQPGTYTVILNVTNSNNLTATATQTITVGQATQPPTAVINAPNQGTAGQPVAFDGSGSTPGSGQIVRYEWTFGDGATGSGATVSHIYARAGNYTVSLKVTNSDGRTATAELTIYVNPAARPPTAVINGPGQGTEGEAVSFDGSGSTPGGGQIVRYEWDFGDGASGSGATVSHTYTRAGAYTVSLKVTNSGNLSASATHAIAIGPAAKPPKAIIDAPNRGQAGRSITFDGSHSTPGGQITSYAWDFGDGTTGSGATVSHAYASAGSYTVGLTVTSSTGQTANAMHAIRIEGGQPGGGNPPGGENPPGGGIEQPNGGTPLFGGNSVPFGGGQGGLQAVISAPVVGRVNQPITFDGSRSSGGQIASYAWKFGDGTTGSGATASHAYAKAGLYNVSLTVTDSQGRTATASRAVVIP
jgi:PKD repeat protein